jgi:hypothetical protein
MSIGIFPLITAAVFLLLLIRGFVTGRMPSYGSSPKRDDQRGLYWMYAARLTVLSMLFGYAAISMW